jgi:hypothetical protein
MRAGRRRFHSIAANVRDAWNGSPVPMSIPWWIEHPIDKVNGQINRLWNGMAIGKLPVIGVAPGASRRDVGVDV